MRYLYSVAIIAFFLSIPACLQAKPLKANQAAVAKERLVLMPLRLSAEERNLQSTMESALVEGLQRKYEVLWGEDVEKKAREVFNKENRKHECDETRCFEKIAGAFQAELIANASVTKQDGGYFLSLNIQNIFDRKLIYTKPLVCEHCTAFKVVDKLKELSGPPIAGTAPLASTARSSKVDNNKEEEIGGLTMVRIPNKNFQLGKYEVTQGQWRDVMGENPSYFKNCGDSCPVEQVSFEDVQTFIKKVNANTGEKFRLPSESEWEYACRGGSDDKFCGGSNLDTVAWFNGNSDSNTHPVGEKEANAYELYDMSGNVWEWTSDCGEDGCGIRVLRGGAWGNPPKLVQMDFRARNRVNSRESSYGFRLARTLR